MRPSSCTVKGGTPSSRRYLPTYLLPWLWCWAVSLARCGVALFLFWARHFGPFPGASSPSCAPLRLPVFCCVLLFVLLCFVFSFWCVWCCSVLCRHACFLLLRCVLLCCLCFPCCLALCCFLCVVLCHVAVRRTFLDWCSAASVLLLCARPRPGVSPGVVQCPAPCCVVPWSGVGCFA